jgi:hypothetical protein
MNLSICNYEKDIVIHQLQLLLHLVSHRLQNIFEVSGTIETYSRQVLSVCFQNTLCAHYFWIVVISIQWEAMVDTSLSHESGNSSEPIHRERPV